MKSCRFLYNPLGENIRSVLSVEECFRLITIVIRCGNSADSCGNDSQRIIPAPAGVNMSMRGSVTNHERIIVPVNRGTCGCVIATKLKRPSVQSKKGIQDAYATHGMV